MTELSIEPLSNLPWYASLVAGFAFAFVLTFVVRLVRVQTLTRRPYLQTKELRLELDFSRNELVVMRTGENRVPRLPFLTIAWHISFIRQNRPARSGRTTPKTGRSYFSIDSLKLPEAYHCHTGLTPGGLHSHIHFETTLSNGTARKARAWLEHHRQRLAPDVAGYLSRLDKEREDMAAACRRHLPETVLFELSSHTRDGAFSYVAFLKSGAVYGATGEYAAPVPISSLRTCVNNQIRVFFSNSSVKDFSLTSEQRSILQHLQRKALLTIGGPIYLEGM